MATTNGTSKDGTAIGPELARWALALGLPDIPQDVVDDAKLRVLDIVGVCLAASTGRVGAAALAAARVLDGDGEANTETGGQGRGRVIGTARRLPPASAALVIGTLAHALDFDDTHNETVIHVSAPIVTTALAQGEASGCSGAEVLAAVVAGREVTCRIGLAAPGAFHARGFHATGLLGTLGAAVTASRLLGSTPEQAAAALGISGSQAAGLLEFLSDGTDVKTLHPGWAAHSGIWAAALAAAGLTGPATVIEGRFGVFASHLGGTDHAFERVTHALGREWTSLDTSFKPYPCGHVLHQFVDALQEARAMHGLQPADVESITARIAGWMTPIVCEPLAEKRRPKTSYDAKFSMPYTLAALLVDGAVDVGTFTAANIHRPEILDVARRVDYEIDETAPGHERYKGWVVVRTKHGETIEATVDANWGSAANPMSREAVVGKFLRNAVPVVGQQAAQAIVDEVAHLEDAAGIGPLLALCDPTADHDEGAQRKGEPWNS